MVVFAPVLIFAPIASSEAPGFSSIVRFIVDKILSSNLSPIVSNPFISPAIGPKKSAP